MSPTDGPHTYRELWDLAYTTALRIWTAVTRPFRRRS